MADLDIHYDPITLNNNPATVTIQGLDNIKETLTLQTPQPIKSETKSDFNFPEPIRTEAKAELDIKPLALDQCLTIRIAPLPPTQVRQPYQQHFGITLFGVEWLGFNLEGETQVIVSDLPRTPTIAWGEAQSSHSPHIPTKQTLPDERDGLRIRLDR